MPSWSPGVQRYVEFEGDIPLSDHVHDQKGIQLLNLAYGLSIYMIRSL